ncbi:MAG: zf-HC2 domain-containing protein [Eubacterium sp.]
MRNKEISDVNTREPEIRGSRPESSRSVSPAPESLKKSAVPGTDRRCRQSSPAECAVVRDLLPMYVDDVCSEESRRFVRGHLETCPECSQICRDLQNEEIENALNAEKNGVLKRHALQEKSRAFKAGLIISGILMLPVIIVMIVAAAGGAEARMIPVLAASMFLVAAFTAVPLLSRGQRMAKVTGFGMAGLLLIELFYGLFYSGHFPTAVMASTVFGVSIPLFPLFIRSIELPDFMKNKKALTTMLWDTVWFYLMLLADTETVHDFKVGVLIGTYFLIMAWLIFGITRLSALSRTFRTGLIFLITGSMLGCIRNQIMITADSFPRLLYAPWQFSGDQNYHMAVFIAGIIGFLVFTVISLIHRHQEMGEN